MILRLALVAALLSSLGCTGDETVAAYGGADRVWRLVEIDNSPFDARATLLFEKDQFNAKARVSGNAPCNVYTAQNRAPYPWFELGPIAATKLACPELEAEGRFLDALTKMTQSEVLGDVLILRDDDGIEMVFKADG